MVRAADSAGEPLLVVGGGSNLLVADEGFAGTVVRVATSGVVVDSDACSGAMVEVAAGEPWDSVVERAIEEEWSGIEALSGIPGSTGATPLQNVGAYGQEVAQTIARVRLLDRSDGTIRTVAAADCALRLPVQRVPARPALGRPRGDLPAAAGRPGRPDPLCRAGAPPRRRRGRARPGARRTGRRPRAARGARAWSSTRATTTRGAPARSSSTRSSTPTTRRGCRQDAPRYPVDGAIKTSAAWLVEQAGFPRGWGAGARPHLHQAHARPDQPRRRVDRRGPRARPDDPGRGRRRGSASSSSPSPSSSAARL